MSKPKIQNKHILIINRSFWPDMEATGQFLVELCEQLAKTYKVTVIAGRSYYAEEDEFRAFSIYKNERFNGIDILRVRHTRFWKANLIARMINWVTYSVLAFLAALKIKPGIIIVCTDPPFLGIMAMLLGGLKSTPFIYNCRDLFPDVAWGLGRLDKSNFLSQIYDYLNKKAFHSAYFVVCLGESMKDKLLAKGIPEGRIRIITDWVDISQIKPVPKMANPFLKKIAPPEKFIIMYSGNIGLSQDLGVILEAAALIKDKDSFCLVFVGNGAAKDSIKKQANLLGIRNALFFPYQPKEALAFSLGAAGLHIVSLKKGMAGAVVPSKVYGILAAGRPYLALSDKESEAAHIITKYKCGLWVSHDDVEKIADALEWALNHPAELEEMGLRARRLAETKFDKNIVINEWFKILDIWLDNQLK